MQDKVLALIQVSHLKFCIKFCYIASGKEKYDITVLKRVCHGEREGAPWAGYLMLSSQGDLANSVAQELCSLQLKRIWLPGLAHVTKGDLNLLSL